MSIISQLIDLTTYNGYWNLVDKMTVRRFWVEFVVLVLIY